MPRSIKVLRLLLSTGLRFDLSVEEIKGQDLLARRARSATQGGRGVASGVNRILPEFAILELRIEVHATECAVVPCRWCKPLPESTNTALKQSGMRSMGQRTGKQVGTTGNFFGDGRKGAREDAARVDH